MQHYALIAYRVIHTATKLEDHSQVTAKHFAAV